MQKKYRKTVELFANGADKCVMDIPESITLEFSLEKIVKLQDMLAEIKRLSISKATLSEKFENLELTDEDGEEIFPVDDFDPAYITLYDSGLIEITMNCLTKDGEITTDPSINLHDAIDFFKAEKHNFAPDSNVFLIFMAFGLMVTISMLGKLIGLSFEHILLR